MALMIDQNGQQYNVPDERVNDAMNAGLKPAQQQQAPQSAPSDLAQQNAGQSQPIAPQTQQTVTLYDDQGNKYNVPANRVEDAYRSGLMAESVMRHYKPDETGAGGAFVQGAINGASMGTRDEIQGAVQGAYHKLTDEGNQSFSDVYKKYRDAERERQKTIREQHPVAYGAGDVAGALATTAIPIGAGVRGAAGLAKVGGAIGAAQGWGNSEADNVVDVAKDTAKGAAIGAATGAASPMIARGLTRTGQVLEKAADAAKAKVGGAVSNVVKGALGNKVSPEAAAQMAAVADMATMGGHGTTAYVAGKAGGRALTKAGQVLENLTAKPPVPTPTQAAAGAVDATTQAGQQAVAQAAATVPREAKMIVQTAIDKAKQKAAQQGAAAPTTQNIADAVQETTAKVQPVAKTRPVRKAPAPEVKTPSNDIQTGPVEATPQSIIAPTYQKRFDDATQQYIKQGAAPEFIKQYEATSPEKLVEIVRKNSPDTTANISDPEILLNLKRRYQAMKQAVETPPVRRTRKVKKDE